MHSTDSELWAPVSMVPSTNYALMLMHCYLGAWVHLGTLVCLARRAPTTMIRSDEPGHDHALQHEHNIRLGRRSRSMKRACALRAISATHEEKADVSDLARTALGGSRWVIFDAVAASSAGRSR